ncbi:MULTISPECIES: glucose dehydrogenase [Pseudomonas]|uniref:glucose dehydrogenase n=1 Tax=Pseudomonas TaxID=286 RepID=UPI000A5D6FB4|nr:MULTISPECIES: glucose dehydrogenase [Pseudomonas]
MKQGTLANGTGVSSLLFGVYTILLALLGLTLACQGSTLVSAGGSPYYAMMGTALLLSAALMGLKKSLGIYLYGAASLATYGWAIWESGYNGWAYIPRLAWLVLLSVIFLAFWPLVRRTLPKSTRHCISASWGGCRC